MKPLSDVFQDVIQEASERSKTSTLVTEHNVYQSGQREIIPLLDTIVEALLLPGSGVGGMEHLEKLLDLAESGKSCLLLLEHYSNLDLPIFSYLLRKEARGAAVSDAIVAIAGMKLNETSHTVAAFSGAYTRIVIYPSRSLQGLDPEKDRSEIIRSNAINRAAMKSLIEVKRQGKLILVFPSGTRYRPWDPSTKKGVREIDSYIKSFDYMCFVAINGEVLHVREGSMLDDYISRDVVRCTASPVVSCGDFRNSARSKAETDGIADKKQAAADAIMDHLDTLHEQAETDRQKFLANAPQNDI
ncbi:MAG: 1-acyl-sn-glycerol-3-phosphate acyltransferase [Spirochaetaceae bacterium]|jgi:glycerol-3-phosphate O-acyltransferase|nr:1-acyl-sn-glycerol-3-phosphate acyltransferase [Spirochaetaceae bacterium]